MNMLKKNFGYNCKKEEILILCTDICIRLLIMKERSVNFIGNCFFITDF